MELQRAEQRQKAFGSRRPVRRDEPDPFDEFPRNPRSEACPTPAASERKLTPTGCTGRLMGTVIATVASVREIGP
jgi:hypothetical protein